jgi:membrane associated rhomboid family serine protease
MAMSYSEKQYQRKMLLGQKDNHLFVLIGVCLILFVMLAFIKAVWFFNYPEKAQAITMFNSNVMSYFTLPASFNGFLHRPWTLISSIFVANNNDFWKVFPNMFWLWSFGFILQDITGGKKLVPIFIYGGVGGAIAFMLIYNFIPSLYPQMQSATLGGIACGVIAVSIVTTMISPRYKLFPMISGGIPLWVLTGLYLVSDFATVSIADTGTLLTHVAAALTGVLFTFFLHRGYDWSEWMNNFFDWVNNLFEPGRPKKGKAVKDELFYKSSTAPYTRTAKITQERVDEILDKIGHQGYEKLTDDEKDILKRASKEGL